MDNHGKYLQQIETGYIYIWTETQAARTDMRTIDDETAERLLVRQRMTHAQKEKEKEAQAKELVAKKKERSEKAEKEPDVVKQEPDDEPVVESSPEDATWVDKDIKMLEEIRSKGRGKTQVEIYMKENYGIDVDRRLNLDTLVDQAVAIRKEALEKELTA